MSRAAPSPEELAAIVAAVEVAWPSAVAAEPDTPRPQAWRFSGRWWLAGHLPSAARRTRP